MKHGVGENSEVKKQLRMEDDVIGHGEREWNEIYKMRIEMKIKMKKVKDEK